MGQAKYNAEQIQFILAQRDLGFEYRTIAASFTDQYSRRATAEQMRHIVRAQVGGEITSRIPRRLLRKRDVMPAAPKIDAKKELARNARILFLSDMHIPYQHPDTFEFLAALKEKYKPTRVICVGDEVDHHAMSFHDTDPDLLSAGDELSEAIDELRPFYKLFPEVDLVDSNHGSMAYRKGKHFGMPRKYIRDYGEVLEAPDSWKWHLDMLIDLPGGNQLYIHHGLSADVMKVVAQRGVCAVQGHFHNEFRIGYIGNPNHLLWGMNVGCSINSRSLAFAYDSTNLKRPVIGHALAIDGLPQLAPMVLDKHGRWNGAVP